MKVHVIRAASDATLGDAVDMMDLYQITTLPVVDDRDHIIGIISESDIVQRLLPAIVSESDLDFSRDTLISDLMFRNVISVDEGEEVKTAANIMLERNLKRLPVTSDGRLVGTIARVDICQSVLEGEWIIGA